MLTLKQKTFLTITGFLGFLHIVASFEEGIFSNVDALLSSSEKGCELRTVTCNLGKRILCYQICSAAFCAGN